MALEHNPKLTKIYSSLDDFALGGDPDKVGNQPPTYLLNENLFDDIEYILNKNVLINYTLNDLVITKQGKLLTEPRDRIFTWYGIAYGEEMRLMPYLQCTLMQHDACSLTTMCMSIALQVFPPLKIISGIIRIPLITMQESTTL